MSQKSEYESSEGAFELDDALKSIDALIDDVRYLKTVKFIHPSYKHVWLTEGSGRDVAEELIPSSLLISSFKKSISRSLLNSLPNSFLNPILKSHITPFPLIRS